MRLAASYALMFTDVWLMARIFIAAQQGEGAPWRVQAAAEDAASLKEAGAR